MPLSHLESPASRPRMLGARYTKATEASAYSPRVTGSEARTKLMAWLANGVAAVTALEAVSTTVSRDSLLMEASRDFSAL